MMAKDGEKDIEAMTAAEEEFDDLIVFTDDDGHEHLFYEEQQFVVGDRTYALLVGLSADDCGCGEEECHCHEDRCECDEEEETEVILTKVEFDEDGNPVYVNPTDEEFAEAKEAYETWEEQEDGEDEN